MKNNKPIVLILCGGKSLRLWPLSEYKSKNFLDIFGFSPLELTIKRFLKITSIENIFLVTSQKERKNIRRARLIKKGNIFFEPESKNTAAAILLSLLYLKKRFSQDDILVISPVDHIIKGEKEFYSALKITLDVAGGGWICTLGIKPVQSTPNFGYIEVEKEIEKNVFSVKRFIEKPARPLAGEIIRKGNSFYNSGIFISSLSTLDKEYKKYYNSYEDFTNVFNKLNYASDRNFSAIYRKIESIPFDRVIMEKTTRMRLVKGSFFWKDFGSWHAIYEALAKDRNGNVKKGNIFINNGENNFIYLSDSKKKVLVTGLKDIFFVDTDEYALLTHRHYLDNLKLALKDFKVKVR
jgi:mannose-1-phosphate guanylyltransferase